MRGCKIGVTQWFRENSPIYPIWQRIIHIVGERHALFLQRNDGCSCLPHLTMGHKNLGKIDGSAFQPIWPNPFGIFNRHSG